MCPVLDMPLLTCLMLGEVLTRLLANQHLSNDASQTVRLVPKL